MYSTGMQAKRGTYWSVIDGSVVVLKEDGILQGMPNAKYLKVSSTLTLIVAPLLGLMFVMLLPLLGIVVMIALASLPVLGAIVSFMNDTFNKRLRHEPNDYTKIFKSK